MKKIVAFILLMCMVLPFVACAETEGAAPKITVQEVYEAGKTEGALLGDHENVYIQARSGDKVLWEKFLSREYKYAFYDAEYMNIGMETVSFSTDHSEYTRSGNSCVRWISLAPDGMVDLKEYYAAVGTGTFISGSMLNDNAVITEKDGLIIATSAAGEKTIEQIGYGVVACVETYTLDAETREMISVKTVYTYEDGTIEEGLITITHDAEIPESVKPFLAYDQETENLSTLTIVSNPGAENEKTESVQVFTGLSAVFSPDLFTDNTFTVYADAACTQVIEGELEVNSDVTVYIKWAE